MLPSSLPQLLHLIGMPVVFLISPTAPHRMCMCIVCPCCRPRCASRPLLYSCTYHLLGIWLSLHHLHYPVLTEDTPRSLLYPCVHLTTTGVYTSYFNGIGALWHLQSHAAFLALVFYPDMWSFTHHSIRDHSCIYVHSIASTNSSNHFILLFVIVLLLLVTFFGPGMMMALSLTSPTPSHFSSGATPSGVLRSPTLQV